MDADGYFWFVCRADDVINTAGHLVGPFEVESALKGERHDRAIGSLESEIARSTAIGI